jgi:hypothetical protein
MHSWVCRSSKCILAAQPAWLRQRRAAARRAPGARRAGQVLDAALQPVVALRRGRAHGRRGLVLRHARGRRRAPRACAPSRFPAHRRLRARTWALRPGSLPCLGPSPCRMRMHPAHPAMIGSEVRRWAHEKGADASVAAYGAVRTSPTTPQAHRPLLATTNNMHRTRLCGGAGLFGLNDSHPVS